MHSRLFAGVCLLSPCYGNTRLKTFPSARPASTLHNTPAHFSFTPILNLNIIWHTQTVSSSQVLSTPCICSVPLLVGLRTENHHCTDCFSALLKKAQVPFIGVHTMSLSRISPSHPMVCSRKNCGSPNSSLPLRPRAIDWNRVVQATAVAATATIVSQVVAAPLDVGIRAAKASSTPNCSNTFTSLMRVIREKGWRAAFQGLPLHLMMRLPTKSLTVALFEVGSQTIAPQRVMLNPSQHISVAMSAGVAALFATYPAHFAYYAMRKDVPMQQVIQFAKAQPRLMYSGAIPGLVGTAPGVLVDYFIYKRLRSQIDESSDDGQLSSPGTAAAVVTAAAASNLMGRFCSEPFRVLSRKMAVESARSAASGSLSYTARAILQTGVGEFWRGFPNRSLRYVLSAVASKATVQQLRRFQKSRPMNDTPQQGTPVSLRPAGRSLGPGLYQARSRQHHSFALVDSRYRQC